MSEDALTNPQKLMVLIHGSGVVRAGQWARRLIINEDLDSGTQIPFIKRAMDVSALSFIFFWGGHFIALLYYVYNLFYHVSSNISPIHTLILKLLLFICNEKLFCIILQLQ